MSDSFERTAGRLEAALQALGGLAAEVSPALPEALRPMAAAARAEAPVLTGELRAAIAIRPGPAGPGFASAEVTVPVEHGVHRDLGTRHLAADAFLQRAADATEDTALDHVEREITRALDDLLR